jgi:hypothetical protein
MGWDVKIYGKEGDLKRKKGHDAMLCDENH